MATSKLQGIETQWRHATSDLSDKGYSERMLSLVLNADDTFELRYVDYENYSAIAETQDIPVKLPGKGEMGDEEATLPVDPEAKIKEIVELKR